MKKYIDADKLISEIERLNSLVPYENNDRHDEGLHDAYKAVKNVIDSLQQEQSKSSKGKFVFPKFLYARTIDNKTIDVSYVPQSMDAVEYIQNDHIEQTEVDFEEEFAKFNIGMYNPFNSRAEIYDFARHFWNKGYNAREKKGNE